jgi:very-short-patch-repair endonuclease
VEAEGLGVVGSEKRAAKRPIQQSFFLPRKTDMATGHNAEIIHTLPRLRTFRTKLREQLTPAEATLWIDLKGSKLDGRKFRRQHSVGNYILDFYCPAERLGLELDGEVHFNERAREYDYERKLFLNAFGIKVLRFENRLVYEERDYIFYRIRAEFSWWERDPSGPASLG